MWAESANLKTDAKEDLTAAIRKLVHIPGDPLSLKAPAPAQAAAALATPAEDFKPAQHLGDAPAAGSEDQPRMSLDQELDMEQVRQEILQAEKKLFDESENNTPVPSRPSTPAPSSTGSSSSTSAASGTPTKPLSRTAFQKSKSAASLTSSLGAIAPNALFTMFYKRTASWPRVPYPIGSEDLKPLPDNLTVVRPMNHSLDFEAATEEARAIFEKLCPGEEFLPPTPEPEDNSGF